MAFKINTDYPAKKISYGSKRSKDKIKYIVIHGTGNKTDSAVGNAKYFNTTNTRQAGAHYFVDGSTIAQSVDPSFTAWAVGGKKYSDCVTSGGGSLYGKVTNSNSISIEMCGTDGHYSLDTLNNTADFVVFLLRLYGLDMSSVVRHFDVNGKHCPGFDKYWGPNATYWNNLWLEISRRFQAQ